MLPFFILVIASVVFRCAGRLGLRALGSWSAAGRAALAAMFLFTGATHFSAMKHDYLAMIPDALPKGMWVISLTGALQIAGAVGLLIPRLRALAALGLVLLLVAMFPANVYAAIAGVPFRGESPTALWLRAPIQLAFIAALWGTTLRAPGGGVALPARFLATRRPRTPSTRRAA